VNKHLGISFVEVQISKKLELRIKRYGEMKSLGDFWAWRAIAGDNELDLTTLAQQGG
jgi:hypothetical protein